MHPIDVTTTASHDPSTNAKNCKNVDKEKCTIDLTFSSISSDNEHGEDKDLTIKFEIINDKYQAHYRRLMNWCFLNAP